ncbi:MAG: protein kinase domain-containing protein [Syntrophomonadaceae bacterium]
MEPTILNDRYELLEQIGEGGMSYVYRARCRILDRIVAVKILKEEYSNDLAFVSKFKTEAMAAARLSHPNIVNIFDVGQQDDIYYIVMEYVEGKTLKELIAEQAPLKPDQAINIAIMICDGIAQAHEKGIIHKDIKPHNILITTNGMVKVADFGIAQAISKKTITYGGNIIGSVHYISPEQAKGEPLTPATDIYSVGCVLYEMLTGSIPFDAESPVTVALKHIHNEPTPPREINSNISPGLESLINRSMEKLPSRRFKSAEEMRNALINTNDNYYTSYKAGNHHNGDTIIMAPVNGNKNNKTKRKKIRATGVLIAIIAVFGLFSGILFMLGGNIFGNEVVVPDIIGKSINEANDELAKLNLTMNVKEKQYNDSFAKDTIIYQDPGKGQKVKEGREIDIILSLGPQEIEVPQLVGSKLTDAEITLRNNNLEIGNVEEIYDDKYKEGYIISQNPKAGAKVLKNEKVDLMVSKGETPAKVSMPNLIGLNLEAAKEEILKNNLRVGEIRKDDSDEYFLNQVIEQNTDAGVMVDEGTTVNLVISKGPGPLVQTKVINLTLPDESDFYKVSVILHDSQGDKEIYNQVHAAQEHITLGVNYLGDASIEIKLNDKPYKINKL